MQACQDMHMIGNASNLKWGALLLVGDAAQVGMQFRSKRRIVKVWLSMLC